MQPSFAPLILCCSRRPQLAHADAPHHMHRLSLSALRRGDFLAVWRALSSRGAEAVALHIAQVAPRHPNNGCAVGTAADRLVRWRGVSVVSARCQLHRAQGRGLRGGNGALREHCGHGQRSLFLRGHRGVCDQRKGLFWRAGITSLTNLTNLTNLTRISHESHESHTNLTNLTKSWEGSGTW